MIRHLLAFVFLAAMIFPAGATSAEISPGKYIRNNDTGSLNIQKNKKNELSFAIESTGGNCHSCSVSGVIQNDIGYTGSKLGSKCFISFSATKSAVVVQPTTEETCRDYCGARANIAGTYNAPPAACTSANRQAQRNRFLVLYRSNKYSQAASALETLITQCGEFMNSVEIDQVRNDLALSRYHNRETAQCLKTLNATLAGQVKNEAELRSGNGNVYLPPCDLDNYIETARTIWSNKALCNQTKQR